MSSAETAVQTLTGFLLERIEEDEAFAEMVAHAPKVSAGESRRVQEGNAAIIPLNLASSPSRVLAECAAKRRIVDVALPGERDDAGERFRILRILATVYADHPDYRDEWRP